MTHWSDTHLYSRLWEERWAGSVPARGKLLSPHFALDFFYYIIFWDFFLFSFCSESKFYPRRSTVRLRAHTGAPGARKWRVMTAAHGGDCCSSGVDLNWKELMELESRSSGWSSVWFLMMDGGKAPWTSTPDLESFGKTREEKTQANWWNLGSLQTAAVLWGSQMVTQKAYSFCSYLFSRRKWIHLGGELVIYQH